MYNRRNPMLHDLYHEIGSWLRRRLNWLRARRAAGWVRIDAVIRSAEARLTDERAFTYSSKDI